MKKIRDIITKPSQAIKAMLDGLERNSRREDFIIDMNTFGQKGFNINGREVCYGCAATCAVQEVIGQDLISKYFSNTVNDFQESVDSISRHFSFDQFDIFSFEEMIDNFRKGWRNSTADFFISTLFNFFKINLSNEEKKCLISNYYFSLINGDWKTQLPIIRKLQYELEYAGY